MDWLITALVLVFGLLLFGITLMALSTPITSWMKYGERVPTSILGKLNYARRYLILVIYPITLMILGFVYLVEKTR
jgi:hypothetical protein